MISVSQVLAAITHHSAALPPGATIRWAFLVTFEEIDALVDELLANPEFGVQLTPDHAQLIKNGRAMLHLQGTPVIPELEAAPHLDG